MNIFHPPSLLNYLLSLSYHALALKDLKANESRLKDINKVAEDLESEGLMAEEVQAAQQQVSVWVWRGGGGWGRLVTSRKLVPS